MTPSRLAFGISFLLYVILMPAVFSAPASLQSQVDAIKERIDENRIDEAHTAAIKLLQKNPRSALAHSAVGRVLLAKGDFKGCEREERKAIKLDPKLAEAHWYLGMALQQLNKHDEAMAELQVALKLKPKLVKDKNCSDCNWIKQMMH